jgi:hypothetical protein
MPGMGGTSQCIDSQEQIETVNQGHEQVIERLRSEMHAMAAKTSAERVCRKSCALCFEGTLQSTARRMLQDQTLEEVEVSFQQEVSLLTKKLAEEQQKYARLQVLMMPRQCLSKLNFS